MLIRCPDDAENIAAVDDEVIGSLELFDDGAPVPEFIVRKTADAQGMPRSHLGFDIGLSIARMDAVPITPGGTAKLIGSHDRAPAGG